MNFKDYKQKIFELRPSVKEEYDALEPQYAMTRLEMETDKMAEFAHRKSTDQLAADQAHTAFLKSKK